MIIKPCGTHELIQVKLVEITGDSTGMDIWYHVNDDESWYHDITVDVIKRNKKVDKFIKQIKKVTSKHLSYDFKYIIKLD